MGESLGKWIYSNVGKRKLIWLSGRRAKDFYQHRRKLLAAWQCLRL